MMASVLMQMGPEERLRPISAEKHKQALVSVEAAANLSQAIALALAMQLRKTIVALTSTPPLLIKKLVR